MTEKELILLEESGILNSTALSKEFSLSDSFGIFDVEEMGSQEVELVNGRLVMC